MESDEVIIARQEKQIAKEMGQLFEKKAALTGDQSFCCSKLPSYAVNNFNSLLDMNDSWKNKKSVHKVTS